MRVCAIAAAGIVLAFTGPSPATALDAPGTVYIDGVPCNLACQAYMDWSRRTLNAHQNAEKTAGDVADKRQVFRRRISRPAEPAFADRPPRNKAGNVQATIASRPEPTPLPVPRSLPRDNEAPATTAAIVAEPAPLPVPRPPAEVQPPDHESSRAPAETTPRQSIVAALAVAEQMTNAELSQPVGDDRIKPDAATLPPAPGVDRLVAILIARPDVKSPAGLKDQSVAIDKASGYEADIRFALIAAGATGAELSATDESAIDRVIRGDVQAAVLKLVTAEAAEAFPGVKDLNVLRVPLTPR
jgi:hypothetical protein